MIRIGSKHDLMITNLWDALRVGYFLIGRITVTVGRPSSIQLVKNQKQSRAHFLQVRSLCRQYIHMKTKKTL